MLFVFKRCFGLRIGKRNLAFQTLDFSLPFIPACHLPISTARFSIYLSFSLTILSSVITSALFMMDIFRNILLMSICFLSKVPERS